MGEKDDEYTVQADIQLVMQTCSTLALLKKVSRPHNKLY